MAARYAAIEEVLLAGFFSLAGNKEHAIAGFDIEVLLAEAGYGQRDPIMGLIGPLNVVGRIPAAHVGSPLHQTEQMVETDGRAGVGGKIKFAHVTTSLERCNFQSRRQSGRPNGKNLGAGNG